MDNSFSRVYRMTFGSGLKLSTPFEPSLTDRDLPEPPGLLGSKAELLRTGGPAGSGTLAAKSASDRPEGLVPVDELRLKLERNASLLEFPVELDLSPFPGSTGSGPSSSSNTANLFELLRSWLPKEPERALSPRSDTVGGG